jgi:KipI family sensor histidine kinase inhibitor
MLYDKPKYRTMGDRGLLVELGDGISQQINRKVRALFLGLDSQGLIGIKELVPSYRSLLIVYDPLMLSLNKIKNTISKILAELDQIQIPAPKTVEIPVLYNDDCGPDLKWVADYHGMTPSDVIGLHTQPTYWVYMIGFTPGFPYMGEILEALVTPRRESPRTHVPRGSVGIAQKQTGIYPVESPGGWQIIGRTPVTLFNPESSPAALLEMGDLVQFYAITEEEFDRCQL